jgi:hypothetical protein
MLFRDGKSSLVRLSDCIKVGIASACVTTEELVSLHATHAGAIAELREAAKRGDLDELEKGARIPASEALRGVQLQGQLHTECLAVILNTCLTLESYVNSLAFHMLKEKDFLGLIREGHDASAELLYDAIDRLSTPKKWEELARFGRARGFDPSKAPFQDLTILFRFRNDVVHDKVREYSDEVVAKRYGGKLTDPTLGFLDLNHVIYGADTYSALITEIHELTGVPSRDFLRHYNVMPWFSEEQQHEARELGRAYARLAHTNV